MHKVLLSDAIYINNLYMTTISRSRYPNFLGSQKVQGAQRGLATAPHSPASCLAGEQAQLSAMLTAQQ